jgi:hypothetical protein
MTGRQPRRLGTLLPGVVADIAARANAPGFDRWREQVTRTGGCAHPIHLVGQAVTVATTTGLVLHTYDTDAEPTGRLLVACGNRRASVCPACSALYRADTYQLIRAGLAGGKGVPDDVREHPCVFATLTAPSFGPVHSRRERHGRVEACRPRRDGGTCPHGQPLCCGQRHTADDPLLGEPLCAGCYDYVGAVLWQAHAGTLWHRFTIALRRELASAAGLSQAGFARHARLSYAKVAEYQRRGLVHFHAVIRLDGPDGPSTSAPRWASVGLLEQAIRTAAARVRLTSPGAELVGARTLMFGDQLDAQPLTSSAAAITPEHVAGYIAKYATKAAESAGAVDTRIRSDADLNTLPVRDHVLRMIGTCWWLGGLPAFAELGLRRWAHMLGYRGHCTTKSRRYSTTLGALRQVRVEHRAAQHRRRLGLADAADAPTVTVGQWRYAGQGHSPGEALLAAGIRVSLSANREQRRTERRERRYAA